MERVFTLPGLQWANEVGKFSEELFGAYERGVEYPIRRVFELLPINVLQNSNADLLIGRGTLKPDPGATSLHNEGEYIDALFGDANLGRVGIVFPETIHATVSKGTEQDFFYSLDFSGNPIPVALYDMPAEYEVKTKQELINVKATRQVFSYRLRASGDHNDVIRLDVDLTRSLDNLPHTLSPLGEAMTGKSLEFAASTTSGKKKCWTIDTPCCKCCEYESETGDCSNSKPPSSGPVGWYAADAACDFGPRYAAHFTRSPFWYEHPPAGFFGSVITIVCNSVGYPSTCGDGQAIVGTFKMRATETSSNPALVYKFTIFGEKLNS